MCTYNLFVHPTLYYIYITVYTLKKKNLKKVNVKVIKSFYKLSF